MSTPREYFDAWFVKVLQSLYPCEDAGFVILMATFPLLERYLRQRAGLTDERDRLPKGSKFYEELRDLFPELRNIDEAWNFWQVYRHGLLHQVTFSQRAPVMGLASRDEPKAISIDQKGNFCVHPVHFSERVLTQIGDDFPMFEGASSTAPPFPTVRPHQMAPNAPIILGTSAEKPQSWDGASAKPSGPLESQVC